MVKRKTYIDNNGIEIVPKRASKHQLLKKTTFDQRRFTKHVSVGSSKGQFDGLNVSSRRLDLGPKTAVQYSKMSDAQKVNILYNSMLNKQKRE